MTTDYASLIAASLKSNSDISDKLSLKVSFDASSQDKNLFDNILSKASKSYADYSGVSSENSFNSSFKSNDYARDTKDINKTKETQYSDKKENVSSSKDKNITNEDKFGTSETSQKEDYKTKENTEDSIKTNETDNKKNEDITQKEETQEVQAKDENNQEASSNNTKNEDCTNKNTENTDSENKKSNETDTKNTIANEQIIANIEYSAEIPVTQTDIKQTTEETASQAETVKTGVVSKDVAAEMTKTVEIQLPDEVISKAVNSEKQIDIKQSTNTSTLQDMNTVMQDTPDIDVKVETVKDLDLQKADTKSDLANVKTAKENLAADQTRYTVNIESTEGVKNTENTQNVKNSMNTENIADEPVLTPTSPKSETTTVNKNAEPYIKVTDEVASQTQSTAANMIENKDLTSSTKDKATAQMADLQDTNTVVTNVQDTSKNQTQSNANQNNSMQQGNAAEQIAKFSVDNADTSVSGTEGFLNKLEAKLSASSKSVSQNSFLNKSDIMSQINAKFTEMQQAGQNKVSMILQPENLGKVSVEIMNSKDGIVAKMTTDNQQVKELFDRNIEALKSNLSSQGVNVNNIKIEYANESSNNAMNFERDQFNQNSFNQSNGQNQHTNNSQQNSQTSYSTEYTGYEDTDMTETREIKNTDTLIKHNGKVDYKV